MKGVNLRPSTRGLLPFEPDDAATYYIQDTCIELFFRALKKNRFVFLRGNRGVGKTSFLHTVVLRQITTLLQRTGSDWETTLCRPGLDPVKNLAHAIASANVNTRKVDVAMDMETLLHNGSDGLVKLFQEYPMWKHKNLLLVIDQLEDIFLLEALPHDTRAPEHTLASIEKFINLLWRFEKHAGSQVYVVVAFSNAFGDRIAEYPKLLDLAQKYDFRFEGISLQDIDPVIDKVMPPALHDYAAVASLKRIYREQLQPDALGAEMFAGWRYLLNHSLRRTLMLWHRGFAPIKEAFAESPHLRGLVTSKHLVILVNDLLSSDNLSGEALQDIHGRRLWDTLDAAQQNECLAIVKNARIHGQSHSLLACYQKSGGVQHSVLEEAREIGAYHPAYKKLAEFLIKAMTTHEGEVRPLQYAAMAGLTSDQGVKDRHRFRRFINHCGNKGLGLFQLITSARIEERLHSIGNADYIDDEAVLMIRHPALLQSGPEWPQWVQFEGACISEYLLYAQMSKRKSKTFPVALQQYAAAILTGTPDRQDEHVVYIKTFLKKGYAWSSLHTLGNPKFASLAETKAYIDDGVADWKMQHESRERRERAERRIRKIRIRLLVLVLGAITLFGVYTWVMLDKHRMLRRLTCLYEDYLRIEDIIYKPYIHHLEGKRPLGAKPDAIFYWSTTLMDRSQAVDDVIDELYNENVITFAMQHRRWEHVTDTLLNDAARMEIMTASLKYHYLESSSTEVRVVEGYKLFEEHMLPTGDTLYVVDCTECELP